ncbi:MAG: YfhO family protein [bacterium]
MKYKKDLYAIFFILLLVVIFFSEVLFTNKNFVFRDFFMYQYPIRHFTTECLRTGFIPFWNPYLFCGNPFLANINSAIFYPLSFINCLFPFYFGIKLFMVIHFFLSSLFMYWLMRSWLKIMPSLISSITYGFSGYLLSMIDTYTILATSTWTPLCFLLINRAIEGRNFAVILSGIFLGIQFLAGAPDVFLIAILGLFLFSLSKSLVGNNKGIYSFLLAGLIGMGLTLFQSLPFLEMASFSTRIISGLEYSEATLRALSLAELFTLFIPITKSVNFWFGQNIVKSCYLGIIPFCFILIGIFYSKRKLILFWTVLFFVSLLLAMGKYFPVYQLLYKYIPYFASMKDPIKFFSLTVLSGAILTGFGAAKLMEENKGINFLLIFNLIYFILWLIAWMAKDFILSLWINTVEWYFLNIWGSFLSLILLSLTTSLFILKIHGYVRASVAFIGIIFILIIDLFLMGCKLNPLIDKGFYDYEPEIVKLIEKDKDYFRILSAYNIKVNDFTLPPMFIINLKLKNSVHPNVGVPYHLYDAYGYDGFRLKDYDTLISLEQLEKTSKLLSLLNIKYIISHFKLINMDIFYDGGDFKVYKNTGYLKRAFFVPKARVVKDRREILNILSKGDFEPKKEVILEEFPNSKFHPKSQILNPKSKIQIIDYQPNKVIINSSCEKSGFLFLSDTYYPGWKAYIDGKPTKVYRANYLFRAIVLPEGNHQIEFVYFPASFKIGLLGTLITITILVSFMIILRIKHFSNPIFF